MGSLRATADASQIFAAQAPTQIASNFAFGLHTASRPVATNVMINEVDADTPGDDRAEFIELYGPPNTPLDGLAVVLYNGVSTFSPNPFEHQSYAAFDLDGKSTDANGYFVLGNPDVPGVGLTFGPGQFGLLQNGADAVALYVGSASDFPDGTPPDPSESRAFQTLANPTMLGRAFKVLALGRGVDAQLSGFAFARDPRVALG